MGQRRGHALRHLARLSASGTLFGLALQTLGLLNPAIGLGPDPLLLALDLLHLGLNPLFGDGRVVVADRGTGDRRHSAARPGG